MTRDDTRIVSPLIVSCISNDLYEAYEYAKDPVCVKLFNEICDVVSVYLLLPIVLPLEL